MSSLASVASLFVAELDLKLVESVLSAIRTADLQSGEAKKAPLPIAQPSQTVAPARVIRDDHVQAAPVRAGFAVYCCHRNVPAACSTAVPAVVETVVVEKKADGLCSPLAPPWTSIPWKQIPPVPAIIKIVRYEPDIRHKGTLLDCFV